jgi:putative membrane protein
MNLKIFSILTLIILAVIFITQNVTVVEVNLIFWRVTISLALLIAVNLLIGFLLGWFIKSYAGYKATKNIKPSEKEPTKHEEL